MTVAELCNRHRRLGLDSNLLIYLLEGIEPWAAIVRELVTRLEAGEAAAFLSSVGLAEVLAGPARNGDLGAVERLDGEIRSVEGLTVTAFTPDMAADAAVIRGLRKVTLPDAMHLASARGSGASAFVTNDRTLRGSQQMTVIYLDELEQ